MAETMLMGLNQMGMNYSYGDIQRQQVKKIDEIARIHGFSLADYRTQKSF
jgi:predicted amino acid dehydrogenase